MMRDVRPWAATVPPTWASAGIVDARAITVHKHIHNPAEWLQASLSDGDLHRRDDADGAYNSRYPVFRSQYGITRDGVLYSLTEVSAGGAA